MTTLWWIRWPRHKTIWEWQNRRAEFWLESGKGGDHLDEQLDSNLTMDLKEL